MGKEYTGSPTPGWDSIIILKLKLKKKVLGLVTSSATCYWKADLEQILNSLLSIFSLATN